MKPPDSKMYITSVEDSYGKSPKYYIDETQFKKCIIPASDKDDYYLNDYIKLTGEFLNEIPIVAHVPWTENPIGNIAKFDNVIVRKSGIETIAYYVPLGAVINLKEEK